MTALLFRAEDFTKELLSSVYLSEDKNQKLKRAGTQIEIPDNTTTFGNEKGGTPGWDASAEIVKCFIQPLILVDT